MKKIKGFLLMLLFVSFYGTTIAQTCVTCQESLVGVITNQSFSNKVICVANDITLNGTVSFTNCELVMGANVEINIIGNTTFSGCHLYACDDMWQGINVRQNSALTINGSSAHSSFVEDAIVAVRYTRNGDDLGLVPLVLDIDNTIFNRNRTSIQIENYDFQTSTFVYPFSIRNTLFTCRDINFKVGTIAWDDLATVEYNSATYIAWPATPEVMSDPYIDEHSYPSTTSAAFLKSPYNSTPTKSEYGIYLKANGYYDSPNYYGLVIGSDHSSASDPNTTIFDNQNTGIYAYKSTLTTYNCTFQKRYQPLGGTVHQYSILAETNDENQFSLRVVNPDPGNFPNNAFFDPQVGIKCFFYRNCEITNCDIRSSMDITAYDGTGFIESAALTGIWVETVSNTENAIVDNNRIYNVETGIYENFVGSLNFYHSIQHNNIGVYSPDVTPELWPAHGAVNTAIQLNGTTTIATSLSDLNSSSNNVRNACTGIDVNSINSNTNYIGYNDIELTTGYDYYNSAVIPGYGIRMQNCAARRYNGNFIVSNSITGDYGGPYGKTAIAAISTEIINQLYVKCNTVLGCINGLYFYSSNLPAFVAANQISPYNTYGFTLDQHGKIGTQGSVAGSYTNDNNWYYNNFIWSSLGSYKTLVSNSSNAIDGELIVKNNTTFDPNGSGAFTGVLLPYSHTHGIQVITPDDYESCNGRMSKTNLTTRGNGNDTTALEYVALGMRKANSWDADLRLYVMQQQAYYTATHDTALYNSSFILQKFVSTNSTGNFQKTIDINNVLGKNDTSKAAAMLSSFVINNDIDRHYQQFYIWVLKNKKLIRMGSATPAQLSDLEKLARMCPYKDGAIVYEARGLYNHLAGKQVYFEDECNVSTKQTVPITKNELTFKVYPNPTPNGQININFGKTIKTLHDVTIMDATGKAVFCKKSINTSIFSTSINSAKGLYFISITDKKTGKKTTEKIILN